MRVSTEVLQSIRDSNYKDNIQANEVMNFMKAMHPHWVSSLATKSYSLHGQVVLSSMSLHKACRNLDAGNSEMTPSQCASTAEEGKKAVLPKITAAKTDIDEDAQAPLDTNQDALTLLPEQKNNEQSTPQKNRWSSSSRNLGDKVDR